jgi:phage-related minor tail protein
MADRINLEDFLDPRIRKELDAINKEMQQSISNMNQLAKEAGQMNKSFNPKNIKQVTDSQKRLSQVQDKSSKEQKKLTSNAEKYRQKLKSVNIEEERYKEEIREKRKELKREIRVEDTAEDSLERKRLQLSRLNDEYDSASSKVRRKLRPQIKKLTKDISKAEEATGRHQRSVGNYTKALGNLRGKVVAVAAGVVAMVRGIAKGIRTFSKFEKQIDKVAAISGATNDEIKALRETAITLGSTTTKTATQVGQLQEEFAKLGLTTDQIIAATEATIRLSEVADSDLAKSAKIAAATLNGFGLEATETQRIVDVMAKSFTSSALDLQKFENAMNKVAPVAANMGFSIEKTTAMIGKLTDAGVRAETAGTQLRNIFLTVAKEGITLEQAFDQINNAADANVASLDLFGKRAAPIAQILAKNTEETKQFANELYNAEGAAQDMSEQITDNLEGDVLRLTSAWEGFVLSIENGTGTISKSIRTIIQGMTNIVQTLTDTNKASSILKDVLGLDYWKDGLLRPNIYKDLGELAARLDRVRVEMQGASSGEIIRQISEWQGRINAVGDETEKARMKQELYNHFIKQLTGRLKENKDAWTGVKTEQKETNEEQEEGEEIIRKQIKNYEKLEQKAVDAFETQKANAQELADVTATIRRDEEMKAELEHEQEMQRQKEKEEMQKKIRQRAFQGARELSQSIIGFQRQELEHEQRMAVEKAKARGASEEEIAQIQEKFAKKRKNLAVTEAIINSSLAITKTLATTAWPLNLIASAIIAAKTAVEIATIRAQKFAKGTKDSGSSDQLAWVGEKGTERVEEKSGKTWYTPDEPTLMPLKAHSKVIPHHQLQRDLADFEMNRKPGSDNNENERRHKEMMHALKDRKESFVNITENGVKVQAKKGHTWYNYIDRKYRT